MAKILVADDNSNVQKTVALALAELGVEVASVSNGEAAVRKLSDFTPDLVLADIFMPVRSGYEVCEYVKKDPRFKHVPVVLLVGAFDPLDEREAQRVGADGILKKPFVPPDPLIAMVKTLLDRALSEHLVTVSASKSEGSASSKTESGAVVDDPLPAPPFDKPPDLDPIAPISSSTLEEGEQPAARGQLLDIPEQDAAVPAMELIEPVDTEQVFTNPRDATLGDPIFWRNDEPETEPEPAQEATNSAGLDLHSWKPAEDSLSVSEDAALLKPIEPLELIRDDQDEPSTTIVESGSILLDAASQADLTVASGKAEELAANPIEWMATAPPVHSEEPADPTPGWDEEIPVSHDAIDLVEPASPEPPSIPEIVPEPVSETRAVPIPAPVFVPAQASKEIDEKTPEVSKTQPSLPASVQSVSPQSVEDTARSIPIHDWADLAAILHPTSSVPAAEPVAPVSATELVAPVSALPSGESVGTKNSLSDPTSPAQPSSPDPAFVEAVVQKVLDKMRPQVVELITKEFLRPIVEALVHREISKR